ncbi:DNA alkylation repair protein [Cryomorphaceae bacterium 1068]|nr:DNA alkylation repair protein [Cryomorphaceae bacterium 1068]
MENQAFIQRLEEAFSSASNREIARGQAAYMRDQFLFLGLKSNARKEILKPFLRKDKPHKDDLAQVVKALWRKPEREYQYAAQELAAKYLRESEKEDIELFEWMITTKSWWDTVDYIAATLVGNYFQKFPDERDQRIKAWLDSGNIWLQRTTLIFQLKYKDQVDTELLADNIHKLLGTKEFFINKAIGWALREYGKVNPDWVVDFVEKNELSNLSKREALKRVKA